MPLYDSQNRRSLLRFVSALLCLLQPAFAAGAPLTKSHRSTEVAVATRQTIDVALQQGGTLAGQVVDSAGVGVAKDIVQLSSGRQRWQTSTNEEGWFAFESLRGGTYLCQAAGESMMVRVWAPGTAPPKASRGILVSPNTDVVRGQRVLSPTTNQFFRTTKHRLTNPWVVGGIVATAVTIPVAIHNADDDDPPATP